MSKIQTIKTHVVRHKDAYVTVGTIIVIAGVAYYAGSKSAQAAAAKAAQAAQAAVGTTEYVGQNVVHNAPQQINCYKPVMNNILEFVELSTPSKQVALVDENGGLIAAFRSIGEAAKQTGISKTAISKVINGFREEVDGMRFKQLLVDELDAA